MIADGSKLCYSCCMDKFTLYGEPTPPLQDEIPTYLSGHLIVADTGLEDPNFAQTAVYLINHDKEGAMGLIINRPSTTSLGEAIEELAETSWNEEAVFIGGPVQQFFVFAVHSGLPNGKKSPASNEHIPGIIFEPDFSLIHPFLTDPKEGSFQIRFFVGYAGWGPGQLEREIAQKEWIIIPASPELVFSDKPLSIWNSALRKKGGIYWIAAETGFKPSLN